MFEDAALEEIEPEDKTRNEVLYARVDIYLAAKKWDMAVAVARHLVKVDPGKPGAPESTSLIQFGAPRV
jgi:lipopolysaccharide biosynthesis regulator YciM